jgi:hypothetical protein
MRPLLGEIASPSQALRRANRSGGLETFPLAGGSLGCVYCTYGGLRSIFGCPGERGGLYQFR